MIRTSVIIVSWNGKAYLQNCLNAIIADTGASTEIIVVDNNSADGSIELVRKEFPQVRLIENKRNLGFAGGCNVGLQAARGEYLALINQDAIIHPGWLDAMLKVLAQADVGIVGCKLLYPNGTIQHAGGFLSYPLAHPAHYGCGEPDTGKWDEQRQVDYVIGAAMGLKRQVLEKVGLFDEGFFPAFYEETDLCKRAQDAGYLIIYTSEAHGTHHETTTIDRHSTDYHRWMHRGRLRFVLKHYTLEQFQEDFLSAERDWLAELDDANLRQGVRMAYLDTVLNLHKIPRTGVLDKEKNDEPIAESLLSLRQKLTLTEDIPRALANGFLVDPPWHIDQSPIPYVVPVIKRLQGLWDSVWRLQEKLAVVQEILAHLDREAVERHRRQVEMIYTLQKETTSLKTRLHALEKSSSGIPQDE